MVGTTVVDNRRTSARHAVSILGTLTIAGDVAECTIQNLSLGGAQLVSTTRQALGQRVRIAFELPTSPEPLALDGSVRWSDGQSVGIQFDGLRARDVWALNEYFKRLVR